MSSDERKVDLSAWRRLFGYALRSRKRLAVLCLTGSVAAAMDVCFPLVTRRLVDDLGARGPEVVLAPYFLAYLALTTLLPLAIWTFVRAAGRVRARVSHDIREDAFKNLQRLSFGYFDHRPVGWLMARMTSDCERLSQILAWGMLDLFWGATLMAGVAAAMVWMDPVLGLSVLSVVPVLLLVSYGFKRRILSTARVVRKTNSLLTADYNECIAGVRTSKTFTSEGPNLAEFEVDSGGMYVASVRNHLHSALFLPLVLTLGSVATGVALAAGGHHVALGGLSLGTLLSFITYSAYFFQPVQELAHWLVEMQMAKASAERILGLIDVAPDVRDSEEVRAAIERTVREGARPGIAEDGFPDEVGRIEFCGVRFAYKESEPVLQGFDLSVEPGETIALVGSTGGGKTTIVSLLCRFYEPTAGEIRIGGVDYRRRGLHWLQSKLGIVLQTPHLFSGTVAENIRYGRLDAGDGEVEEAARMVGAHELFLGLEHGYETEVGESGERLSVGQRQLVSFARALLADPRILVMDEATSSIDTETEARIQSALSRVLAGRTSFVIAHRLSTVRSADRIVVVEAGRIVEQGSHAELMARRGRYFELYRRQSLREPIPSAAWEETGPTVAVGE